MLPSRGEMQDGGKVVGTKVRTRMTKKVCVCGGWL